MWNPNKRKKIMRPFVDTLIKDLKKEGITIILEDPNINLNNIIASNNNKSIKISHHSFYRYSGTGYRIEGQGQDSILIKLTLKDWMFKIIKSIIIHQLNG